jgi:hypothetical protein
VGEESSGVSNSSSGSQNALKNTFCRAAKSNDGVWCGMNGQQNLTVPIDLNGGLIAEQKSCSFAGNSTMAEATGNTNSACEQSKNTSTSASGAAPLHNTVLSSDMFANTTIVAPGPSEFALSEENKSVNKHPSRHLSRKDTNDIQRQNINVRMEYSGSIDFYMRELEE